MPRKEMRGRYRSVRIVQYNVIGYKELIDEVSFLMALLLDGLCIFSLSVGLYV